MANTVYITEYANAPIGRTGQALGTSGEDPPVAEQTIGTSGVSAQSAALNAKTRFVRISVASAAAGAASNGVHVASGANPTATVANRRHAYNSVEYFGVTPEAVAAGLKYAAIDAVT